MADAQKIPVAYEAPDDAVVATAFLAEVKNVCANHKDPEKAWADAVSSVKQIALFLVILLFTAISWRVLRQRPERKAR